MNAVDQRRAVAVPTIAMAGLAALVHVPNFPLGKTPQEDAGVFLYTARLVLDGGVPYRDVWDHKPPLIYYLDALGLLVGGPSLGGVWALQLAALVLAAVLSVRVLSSAFGTWPALVGTATWLLAAPRLFLFEGAFVSFPQLYVPPLQFAALALAIGAPADGPSRRSLFPIGVLGGLVVLLTPAACALWIALAVYWLASRTAVPGPRPARAALAARAMRTALIAAGALVPIAVAAAALAVAGALDDAWDQAVAYNASYARSATLGARVDSLAYGLRLLGSSGALFVAAAGIAAVAWGRAGLGRGALRAVGIALIALPLELVLGASAGRRHEYYWLAALPALGILSAAAAAVFVARIARAAAAFTRISVPRLVAALSLAIVLVVATRPALLSVRVLASADDGITRKAAAYIAGSTTARDELIVWGSRAATLVLAERRSATPFVYQYAPLLSAGYRGEANTDELVRTIRERRPALILDASRDSPATPPLDSRTILAYETHDPFFVMGSHVLRVALVVEELYERAGTVDDLGWPAWRLRAR